jgi:tetratricopeptide (TPR) repeat protein
MGKKVFESTTSLFIISYYYYFFQKVKAVTVQLSDLISQIKLEHKSPGKLSEPIAMSFYSTSDDIGRSTTGINGYFVQTLLLIDALLRMKPVESDKQKLVSLCEEKYQNNEEQLEMIEEFRETYSSDQALWWYSRESFLYKMLNEALRKQDIDILFLFRFIIRDIYEQLEDNQYSEAVAVYRGQIMSIDEVNNLQKSINKIVSINSFFSTSIDRSQALKFIKKCELPDGKERVLFEIDADPRVVTTKPFADITLHSQFTDESEILFMIGSIFHIDAIHQNNDDLWIIRMRLCGDNDNHLKELFAYMKKTYADSNKDITLLSFGRILHQMGKFDLAKQFYERCQREFSSDDPSRSDLYYSLGVLTTDQGDYDECIEWFQKTLKIKSQANPPDYIYLGGIYNAIGDAYRQQEDYNQALEHFNKAVELYKKARADDRLDMAYAYNNIGLVYQEQDNYLEALNFYEKSLAIKQKHLPSNHPSLSTAHNNIGLVHHSLNEYDAALEHYNYSLQIQLKSLPSQHPDIAMSYENMGHVHEDKGEWKQALTYYNNAHTIYRASLSDTHPDTIKNNKNIQRVSSKLK